jgi:translocation and assembly module TamB
MVRRIALLLLWAVGLVGVVLGGAFAFAQTGTGKRLLADRLSGALSSAKTTVRVQGLDGLIPFDFRLEQLRMADAEGPWLELDDFRFSASPSALLRGRIEIERLSAGRLALHRLPPDEDTSEAQRLPELPRSLPPVVVRSISVDRLEVGEAVLGENATFSLEGGVRTGTAGRMVNLTLGLQRTDEDTAHASLAARLDLAHRTLALDLEAAETGGLLAGLTGRPEASDFALALAGDGPLEDWHGDLRLDAKGLARANANIALALNDVTRVRLDGAIEPAPGLLPAPAARLVGDRLELTLAAAQTGPDQLVVEDLRATAALASLTGLGRLDLSEQRVAAQASLRVSELAPLGELVAMPLDGSLDLRAEIDGPLMQPAGRLRVTTTDVAAGDIQARQVQTTLDFAALEQLSERGARVQVAAEGRAQGLRLPPGVALPSQEVVWQARLTAPADGAGTVTLERLTMSADHLSVTAQGSLDATTLGGEAQVTAALDALAPFTAPYGQPVGGAAKVEANLALGAGAEVISIDLYGSAHDLRGLPEGLGELLGPAVILKANAMVVPDEAVEITQLRVEGADASLDGELELGLPERSLDGALAIDLARLAPLSPLLGVAVDGPLAVHAQLGGNVAKPAIELAAESPGLLIAGEHVDSLRLNASGEGTPEAADGTMRLVATARDLQAELATALELRAPMLRLTDLTLSAPRTRVSGGLSMDLERQLIEGELTGRIEQLRAFAGLLPVPLAGELAFEARAAAKDSTQTIALAAQGRDLRSDVGRLGRLGRFGLRASVADALNTPRVTANLTLDDLAQGEVALAEGTLRAEGTPQALGLTVSATGEAYAPYDLDGRIGIALGEQVQVRIEELGGSLANQPLNLAGPATVTLAEGSVAIHDLDLRLADARLRGEFALAPQEVAAEATLDQLPLALLGQFGAPELSGRLGGRLALQGTPADPSGSIRLEATGVAPESPAFADLPPARLALTGELAARRLRLDLRGEGVSERPIRANADLPLVVDLAGGAFEVPPDGQVAGSLDAELSLARLADIAGLDDQRLEGPLLADLTVGGTVADPAVDGTVRIEDALYENGTTGTVLHDLTVLVVANRQTVAIERFAATDGGEGRLSGQGTIGIDPKASYPLDVRLQLEEAGLVARDDITATMSGRLALRGNATAPELRGEVTVNRAEISIPERLGPSVAVLPVQEVGKEIGSEPSLEENGAESEIALRTDLTIDIPSQMFVRGRGLDSDWEGRLRVQGTVEEPRVSGTLTLRRGSFELLDRRFDLRHGTISFTGQTPPSPMLDIEAVAQAEDITAVVRITGEATAPEVELDSEPALPEDEIVARLLFNRDTSELGPGDAIKLAAAINTLRGGGIGLVGQAREALGLDTLGVSGDGVEDARVRAGKYLNDKVYVEVGKGTAEDSEDARVQVEILPNLSLDVEADAQAESGIGLKWRFDY